jgi:hypothetical protein
MKQSTIHLAKSLSRDYTPPTVKRVVIDIAPVKRPSETGITHTGFVRYANLALVVGATAPDAEVWYDLHITRGCIKALIMDALLSEALRLAALLNCGITEGEESYRVGFIEDGTCYPKTVEGLKTLTENLTHDLALEQEKE